ncbi:hypothetical protein B0H63DRAFT_278697 [Podospora didyma]|uniref:Uncharacterized protein n=1 Tax=Podospora didyma TaxID=330526 RepID=A0AAE0KFT4_9PEZI|nr:hypothetical protein B0H63DRAFT_278697 [Podospora didyma]
MTGCEGAFPFLRKEEKRRIGDNVLIGRHADRAREIDWFEHVFQSEPPSIATVPARQRSDRPRTCSTRSRKQTHQANRSLVASARCRYKCAFSHFVRQIRSLLLELSGPASVVLSRLSVAPRPRPSPPLSHIPVILWPLVLAAAAFACRLQYCWNLEPRAFHSFPLPLSERAAREGQHSAATSGGSLHLYPVDGHTIDCDQVTVPCPRQGPARTRPALGGGGGDGGFLFPLSHSSEYVLRDGNASSQQLQGHRRPLSPLGSRSVAGNGWLSDGKTEQ